MAGNFESSDCWSARRQSPPPTFLTRHVELRPARHARFAHEVVVSPQYHHVAVVPQSDGGEGVARAQVVLPGKVGRSGGQVVGGAPRRLQHAHQAPAPTEDELAEGVNVLLQDRVRRLCVPGVIQGLRGLSSLWAVLVASHKAREIGLKTCRFTGKRVFLRLVRIYLPTTSLKPVPSTNLSLRHPAAHSEVDQVSILDMLKDGYQNGLGQVQQRLLRRHGRLRRRLDACRPLPNWIRKRGSPTPGTPAIVLQNHAQINIKIYKTFKSICNERRCIWWLGKDHHGGRVSLTCAMRGRVDHMSRVLWQEGPMQSGRRKQSSAYVGRADECT